MNLESQKVRSTARTVQNVKTLGLQSEVFLLDVA